jgi:arsenic resistance protein ArsH
VRVYHAQGLPLRDPAIESHPKVQELRQLSDWSEGHVWVSPEMHGEVTGTFKSQIDWLPLNTGSVRPTQGRTVMIAQVSGGSQSFNVVNTLRKLARWMRMPCVTNQSSVPKAWKEFTEEGRMKPSELRDRVVDVCEEYYKFTLLMRPYADFLVDRLALPAAVLRNGNALCGADTLLRQVLGAQGEDGEGPPSDASGEGGRKGARI